MPLAYYSRASTKEFWEEHWRGHSVEALIREAETSPLTALILGALPPRGTRVLEAGCGLGQYVVLLRRLGYPAAGTDWGLDALWACRKVVPATPLTVMDLRRLGFRSDSFGAYLSLGVVEHDPEGPDGILREARRVLEPGGVLLLSVPYVNVVRRLGAWWIRSRNRRLREAGGQFYQFAFSLGEGRTFIERNGFRVLRATPYNPGRLLQRAWRRAGRLLRNAGGSTISDGPAGGAPVAARSGVRNAVRGVLYTRPGLHAFGHMILFVAVKR